MTLFRTGRPPPRLFFLHLPKTAGTSMRLYLANQYEQADIFPFDTLEAVAAAGASIAPNHRLYQGHFRYNLLLALPPDTVTLTILREPLQRTLSTLRHLRRDPNFHPDHALARDLSLSEILRTPRLMEPHRDGQTAILSASLDPAAALDMLRDAAEQAHAAEIYEPADLNLARRRLRGIELLGTVRNLDALLASLPRRLGFHPPIRFPLLNENQEQASEVSALTAEDVEILRSYNENDLVLYAFAEALIEQRAVEDSVLGLVDAGVYRIPEDTFALDLTGPIPGSGWYGPESNAAGSWRWTGGDGPISLELPLALADWRVEINLRPVHPRLLEGLSVRVNGAAVMAERVARDGGQILTIPVAGDALVRSRGVLRLELDPGPIPRGSELGVPDTRRLAFAISSVGFARV